MAFSLRRPILVGGLGVTFGAWLLNTIDPGLMHFADSAVWGIAALGSGMWLFKQRQRGTLDLTTLPTVDRTAVEQAIAKVESRIAQLVTEGQTSSTSPNNTTTIETVATRLRQRLSEVTAEMERRDVRLSVTGGRAVGKTTLLELLRTKKLSAASALTIDAIAPVSEEPAAESESETSKLNSTPEQVEAADLVLFVTVGDLTDSEHKAIEQLVRQKQRVLLVFNKQDQYLPDERPLILQQLRDRVQRILLAEDVVAISTQPASVLVRQHQADGTIREQTEQPDPDIAALQARLTEILSRQGQQLVLTTVLRQLEALNVGVQIELNRLRRARAMPIVEQYQWIAAAAAFANPVPSLDLVATASVTAQLIVDLGAIYQQQFSLEQAKTVMANLASQMVKLGLVEVATQAIAPVLKSHALTYVAGGTIQGFSAAYLTRLAGLSLIEYFEEQSLNLTPSQPSLLQVDRLVEKLKAVLQANQRSVFVQNLVKQGMSRLVPQMTQAKEPVVPQMVQAKEPLSLEIDS